MTVKLLATGAAAVAAIGAAAAGLTSVAFGATPGFQVQPAALGVPFAQDPPPPPPPGAPPLPSPEQLSSLCNQVTDPGVSYENKFGLVENGISGDEGHVADHDLRKASRAGNFPEQFNVTNIQPAGPTGVTAAVAITGIRQSRWHLGNAARRRDRAGAGSLGHRLMRSLTRAG